MNQDAGREARESYKSAIKADKRIQSLEQKIKNGNGKYSDADELASRTGRHAGQTISSYVMEESSGGKLSANDANAILRPTMTENYNYVSDLTEEVQRSINRGAGIGLEPVRPKLNTDRIDGLATEIGKAEDVGALVPTLTSQIENASISIVDDFVRENAEAQYNIGRSPKIHRDAGSGCCEWCDALVGTYDYASVKQTGSDVFRRHNNCRCTVEYDPGDGSLQNVHTKVIRQTESNRDIIKNRIAQASVQYEPDILVGQSLSAAFRDIAVRLPNGEVTRLIPGSRIDHVQTIAGLGRRRKIDEINGLVLRYPETASNADLWKKKKGFGYIDYNGESYYADLHWYNHPLTGDVDHKLKPDAGGNWFYDEH